MITLLAEKLSRKFNHKVIFQSLSFEHTEGVLGISGPNGSGKSTLMKCLSYLLRPNEGSFRWLQEGSELSRDEVKALMGFTAPYINLYAELTVFENLKFLVEAAGSKPDAGYIDKLLKKVQIPHMKRQTFGSLSTGQQQRAKIASALIRKPDILLLDEPGSNLDEKGHSVVSAIVKEYSEAGKLVILASNDPKEIALCDNVVELKVES